MHTSFIRLCLLTKCYRDGAAVLDIDLVEFPYVKSKPGEPENPVGGRKEVTYQDVLCYFLYGGMIYMGLKEWRRAADFLTYVGLLKLFSADFETDFIIRSWPVLEMRARRCRLKPTKSISSLDFCLTERFLPLIDNLIICKTNFHSLSRCPK